MARRQSWLGAITSRLRPATKADVDKLRIVIMANQDELLAELDALKAREEATLAKVNDIGTAVDKVGTETDGLQIKIADLERAIANGPVRPDVLARFEEVKAASQATAAAVDGVRTKVQTVDDKVTDAQPTPTPTPTPEPEPAPAEGEAGGA